jgi:hypothetical protein
VKTEDLIVQLATEAVPVRRLPGISVRLTAWVLATLPVVALFVVIVGARADIPTRAAAPAFLISFLTVGALAIASAAGALITSVPGHDRWRFAAIVPLVLMLTWAAALIARLGGGGPIVAQIATEPAHAACLLQISLMAAFPAIALFRAVRAGASVAPGWSAGLTLVAALGAGAAGSALICPIDRAAHEMIWHWLPVAVSGAAGVWAGEVWLTRLAR